MRSVVEQLDVERAGRRAIVRTGRMADADLGLRDAGVLVHGRIFSRKWLPRVGPDARPGWAVRNRGEAVARMLHVRKRARRVEGCAPSTMLRMVPLPRFAGEDQGRVTTCRDAPARRRRGRGGRAGSRAPRGCAGWRGAGRAGGPDAAARRGECGRCAVLRACVPAASLPRPPAGEALACRGRSSSAAPSAWRRSARRVASSGSSGAGGRRGVMGNGAVTPGNEMRGMPFATGRSAWAKGPERIEQRQRRARGDAAARRKGMDADAASGCRCRRACAGRSGAAFALRGRGGGSVTTSPRAMTMTSRRAADSAGRSRRRIARWRWRGRVGSRMAVSRPSAA